MQDLGCSIQLQVKKCSILTPPYPKPRLLFLSDRPPKSIGQNLTKCFIDLPLWLRKKKNIGDCFYSIDGKPRKRLILYSSWYSIISLVGEALVYPEVVGYSWLTSVSLVQLRWLDITSGSLKGSSLNWYSTHKSHHCSYRATAHDNKITPRSY